MLFSYLPLFIVDIVGSVLMIVLSVLCLRKTIKLKSKDPENVILSYLIWVCSGLCVFAVSRSAGHILKQILIINDYNFLWEEVRPVSGALNTFTFILFGSITLFFSQIWNIYTRVLKDNAKLESTHSELMFLNYNLEKIIEERTNALKQESEQRTVLEKHMAQTEKLASIGELSAGVAHEINNPLGIILGYNQLLIRTEQDPQKLNDLKTIEKHVKHCKVIVKDLLNFARSSKTEKKLYQIHKIIDEVIDFVDNHASLGKIEIIRDYCQDLPEICVDFEKIKQLFINLFMNAKHAMGTSGVLCITTRHLKEEGNIRIDISDTGSGIEDKNLSRIFDPFFTTKPTGQGTGLGLSVSYGIVKNHGGDIQVESTLGKGSLFSIYLPADNKCIRGD